MPTGLTNRRRRTQQFCNSYLHPSAERWQVNGCGVVVCGSSRSASKCLHASEAPTGSRCNQVKDSTLHMQAATGCGLWHGFVSSVQLSLQLQYCGCRARGWSFSKTRAAVPTCQVGHHLGSISGVYLAIYVIDSWSNQQTVHVASCLPQRCAAAFMHPIHKS